MCVRGRLLLKVNQIGTVTEALNAHKAAKAAGSVERPEFRVYEVGFRVSGLGFRV